MSPGAADAVAAVLIPDATRITATGLPAGTANAVTTSSVVAYGIATETLTRPIDACCAGITARLAGVVVTANGGGRATDVAGGQLIEVVTLSEDLIGRAANNRSIFVLSAALSGSAGCWAVAYAVDACFVVMTPSFPALLVRADALAAVANLVMETTLVAARPLR